MEPSQPNCKYLKIPAFCTLFIASGHVQSFGDHKYENLGRHSQNVRQRAGGAVSGAPGGLKMAVFFVRRQRSTKLKPASLEWGGTTNVKLPV